MRRLLLTENMTADGRIEMLDEWFHPSPDGDVQDLQDEMERQGASSDAVLLGRQTFEDFRGYWPQHIDEPAGAYLDQVQKYVVSSTMTDPQWRNSTVLSGDPLDEVRRLKDSERLTRGAWSTGTCPWTPRSTVPTSMGCLTRPAQVTGGRIELQEFAGRAG